MPAESVIERLREISATFDEDRNLYGPVVAPPNDVFARNKHGDALDFDGDETALIINTLPLLLAVADAASVWVDEGAPDATYPYDKDLIEAVRALRAGGSDV